MLPTFHSNSPACHALSASWQCDGKDCTSGTVRCSHRSICVILTNMPSLPIKKRAKASPRGWRLTDPDRSSPRSLDETAGSTRKGKELRWNFFFCFFRGHLRSSLEKVKPANERRRFPRNRLTRSQGPGSAVTRNRGYGSPGSRSHNRALCSMTRGGSDYGGWDWRDTDISALF